MAEPFDAKSAEKVLEPTEGCWVTAANVKGEVLGCWMYSVWSFDLYYSICTNILWDIWAFALLFLASCFFVVYNTREISCSCDFSKFHKYNLWVSFQSYLLPWRWQSSLTGYIVVNTEGKWGCFSNYEPIYIDQSIPIAQTSDLHFM